jgi:2-methylcitrate dehydratase PrpD
LEAALFDCASPAFAADEKSPGATEYVAEFILNTRYSDIPSKVIDLAKKSILDGICLALCGSVADSSAVVRKYLSSLGLTGGGSVAASVIGSSLRAPARFAAFANGLGIHADDYADTQLAIGADRVYVAKSALQIAFLRWVELMA